MGEVREAAAQCRPEKRCWGETQAGACNHTSAQARRYDSVQGATVPHTPPLRIGGIVEWWCGRLHRCIDLCFCRVLICVFAVVVVRMYAVIDSRQLMHAFVRHRGVGTGQSCPHILPWPLAICAALTPEVPGESYDRDPWQANSALVAFRHIPRDPVVFQRPMGILAAFTQHTRLERCSASKPRHGAVLVSVSCCFFRRGECFAPFCIDALRDDRILKADDGVVERPSTHSTASHPLPLIHCHNPQQQPTTTVKQSPTPTSTCLPCKQPLQPPQPCPLLRD
jgi:hypothetical protein